MIHDFAKNVLGLDTSKFSTTVVKSTNNFLIVIGTLPNGARMTQRFYNRGSVYYRFQRANFFDKEERNAHILSLSQVLSRIEVAEMINVSSGTVRNVVAEAQCKTATH